MLDGRDILDEILATRDRFGHREHLELAWRCLDRYELEDAHQAVAGALRHLAGLHGMPHRYHETLTAAWVHLVALHRADSPATSFDAFLTGNPSLLDSHLLERHYSRELLAGDDARARWTAPDLRAFPD
jgi:hypothetical protein